jgi:hypothetical protein
VRPRTPCFPLDRQAPSRLQSLPVVLHVSAHSPNLLVDSCVHISVRNVTVPFDSGLGTWLNLDACGFSRLNLRFVAGSSGFPGTFFVVVLARNLLEPCFHISPPQPRRAVLWVRLDDARRRPSHPQGLPTVFLGPSSRRLRLGGRAPCARAVIQPVVFLIDLRFVWWLRTPSLFTRHRWLASIAAFLALSSAQQSARRCALQRRQSSHDCFTPRRATRWAVGVHVRPQTRSLSSWRLVHRRIRSSLTFVVPTAVSTRNNRTALVTYPVAGYSSSRAPGCLARLPDWPVVGTGCSVRACWDSFMHTRSRR